MGFEKPSATKVAGVTKVTEQTSRREEANEKAIWGRNSHRKAVFKSPFATDCFLVP
jgi:hypothetical protein